MLHVFQWHQMHRQHAVLPDELARDPAEVHVLVVPAIEAERMDRSPASITAPTIVCRVG